MINEKLLNEIHQYCAYNHIDDVDKEINKMLQMGFNVMKYGSTPFTRYTEPIVEEKPTESLKTPKNSIIDKPQAEVEIPTAEKPKKSKVRIIKNK